MRYKPVWHDPRDRKPDDGQLILVDTDAWGVICVRFIYDLEYARDGYRWLTPGFANVGRVRLWCAVPPLPGPRPWWSRMFRKLTRRR